ncbi:serine hydrolase [Nonomuraea sp. NN258]|uniref:serine hydrolase n=1 Tax=Nonomuraea antri TaxID=2730852 RepID=UPI00156A5675|nr:serine hydrolase [Nonomuraea antri]NRQ30757.1 serine hydrolase [Nonomuraea antri]
MKSLLIGLAAALTFTATPAAATASAAELTPAAIDAYVRQTMESSGVPGMSVVVTQGGKTVHAAGYGHDSSGAPVTADTPMRVASLSKSFTAMAVMTLVEDGKIALDEPVAAQLPGFRMADPRASRITVRQLLNQTSGLSDRTIDIDDLESATSLADYTARLADDELAGEPGAKWEYCNVNYDLAARLVETASGRRFGDYMRERVFGPLGMKTSALSDDEIKPADGYNSVFGLWVSRPEMPGFHDDSGGGGVITTAADMGRWLSAQTGDGAPLVSAQSLRTMHTPGELRDYGMGWGVDGESGLLTHSGNLFTYNAAQAISPKTGYGFAVMTNNAALTDETYAVAMGLAAMSEGRTPAPGGGERQQFELVLAAIALLSAALGALGVLRARRWAARRAGRSRLRIGLRMIPVLLPAALFAFYPNLVSFLLNGRAVTWSQLTYFAVPLSITLLVAAVAGTLTAAVRLTRLRRICVRRKLTSYTNRRGAVHAHDRVRRPLRLARLARTHRMGPDVPAQRPGPGQPQAPAARRRDQLPVPAAHRGRNRAGPDLVTDRGQRPVRADPGRARVELVAALLRVQHRGAARGLPHRLRPHAQDPADRGPGRGHRCPAPGGGSAVRDHAGDHARRYADPMKGRPGRPAVLTTERIVAAAVEILDGEGLDALTMRRLGTVLGVAAMSLYRHVPNREALLAEVVNRIFAESVTEQPEETAWPEALMAFGASYRRVLLAHPNAVPLLATHPVDVDLGLRLLTGLLTRFEAGGVAQSDALTAVQSVGVYVLGHALAQVGTTPGTTPGTAQEPAAAAFYDQWFDAGLLAMVTGFERQLVGR